MPMWRPQDNWQELFSHELSQSWAPNSNCRVWGTAPSIWVITPTQSQFFVMGVHTLSFSVPVLLHFETGDAWRGLWVYSACSCLILPRWSLWWGTVLKAGQWMLVPFCTVIQKQIGRSMDSALTGDCKCYYIDFFRWVWLQQVHRNKLYFSFSPLCGKRQRDIAKGKACNYTGITASREPSGIPGLRFWEVVRRAVRISSDNHYQICNYPGTIPQLSTPPPNVNFYVSVVSSLWIWEK